MAMFGKPIAQLGLFQQDSQSSSFPETKQRREWQAHPSTSLHLQGSSATPGPLTLPEAPSNGQTPSWWLALQGGCCTEHTSPDRQYFTWEHWPPHSSKTWGGYWGLDSWVSVHTQDGHRYPAQGGNNMGPFLGVVFVDSTRRSIYFETSSHTRKD